MSWWHKFVGLGPKTPAGTKVEETIKNIPKSIGETAKGFFRMISTPLILGIIGLLLIFLIVKKVFK